MTSRRKMLTAEEKAARAVPAMYHGKEARERLQRACSIVSARVAIDFVRDVRGKR